MIVTAPQRTQGWGGGCEGTGQQAVGAVNDTFTTFTAELSLTEDLCIRTEWRSGLEKRIVCSRRSIFERRRAEDAEQLVPTLPELAELRERTAAADAEQRSAAALGRRLYGAIDPDGHLLRELSPALHGTGRVRIIFVLEDPHLELLPWELLNCSGVGPISDAPDGFLALHPRFSIVRTGKPGGRPAPTWVPVPPRVLYVNAGRTELVDEDGPVDEDGRHRRYNKLSDRKAEHCGLTSPMLVKELDGVRYREVRSALTNNEPANIFHFTGHGAGGDGESAPRLLFPSGKAHDAACDRAESLTADQLGDDLFAYRIQLAVLAACSVGADRDWTGFGATLVQFGVRAVVSMQALLDDRAGDEFCKELYTQLRSGVGLDSAVAAARRHLHDEEFRDWWLPLLHTSDIETELRFAPDAVGPRTSVASRPVVTTSGSPVPRQYFFRSGSGVRIPWVLDERGSPAALLSSDAAACARVSGAQVHIGLVDRTGRVYTWWDPVGLEQLEEVLAVHAHARHVELLVVAAGALRTYVVYPDGHLAPREQHPGIGVAATWVGDGFWWIDERGNRGSDDRSASSRLPSRGLTSLDAAIGGRVQMVAVTTATELFVERGSGHDRDGALRSVALDSPPSWVSVVRSTSDAPDEVVVGFRDSRLESWRWRDLTPC